MSSRQLELTGCFVSGAEGLGLSLEARAEAMEQD